MPITKKTLFLFNNIGRLKAKGWKQVYQINIFFQKAVIALLISDKVTSKKRKLLETNTIYWLKKKINPPEEIMILIIYAANRRLKIHETTIDRAGRENTLAHNPSLSKWIVPLDRNPMRIWRIWNRKSTKRT